jgi:hypothetical protein
MDATALDPTLDVDDEDMGYSYRDKAVANFDSGNADVGANDYTGDDAGDPAQDTGDSNDDTGYGGDDTGYADDTEYAEDAGCDDDMGYVDQTEDFGDQDQSFADESAAFDVQDSGNFDTGGDYSFDGDFDF